MMIVDLIEPNTRQKLAKKFSDPVTFIEHFFRWKGKPFKLYPFQKEIARNIDLLHDRAVIQKGRQVGGSIFMGAMIAFSAYTNNDAVFILVSKTAEQSGFIASYVKRFLESNPIIAEIIDYKKTNRTDLWLKNGTVCYNRTAGDSGDNLRGISCENKGALIFDESAYLPDKASKALLHVAHGAGEIHCSTPRRPSGYFHQICHSPDYKRFRIPASKSPRISAEAIERMRRTLRPSEFKTDVMGEFAMGENAVFDPDTIERAINHELPVFDSGTFDFGDGFPFKPDPNKNYVYSLDVAKAGGDQWILTIGDLCRKSNTMQVVAYHAWVGSKGAEDHPNATLTDDPRTIIRDIVKYTERVSARKFYCDTTSNDLLAHVLLNNHLIPVEKIVWSLQKKERMMEHLATVLRAEKLAIPNDPDMVNELLDYSYDVKRMENDDLRRIYLAGGKDDFVSSLCQLSQAITGEQICVGGFIDAW